MSEDSVKEGWLLTPDGCRLAYADVGSGTPVVWQHGLGADRHQPAEVFPDAAGVRRITLECRGHGSSGLGSPARLSIAQFTSDVVQLLDHLGIEKAVVGGISLGAAITLRLAATAPGRVKALILARPAWVEASAPATLRPYLLVAQLLRKFGAEEGLRRFVRSEEYATVQRASPDNAASLQGFFARAHAESTMELLARIPLDGPGVSRAKIAAIRVPTLIVGNAEDFVHPLDYASALQQSIRGARLRVIPSKSVDKALHEAELREALASFLQLPTVAG
jgi:pimeloyl-ACP methyl ester carboxylesterase